MDGTRAAAAAAIAAACAAFASPVQAMRIDEVPLLPVPPGFEVASASVVAINASGQVAGTVTFIEPACGRYCPRDTIRRSYLYATAGGSLAQVGPDGFVATGLSDAGDVVGNLYRYWPDLGTYGYEPGIVHEGVYAALRPTPGTVRGIAPAGRIYFDVIGNDHGVVAGLASDGEHGLWTATWLTDQVDLSLGLECARRSAKWACYTITTGYDAVYAINNGPSVRRSMTVGSDRQNPWSSSVGAQYAFVGWQGRVHYLHDPTGGSIYDSSAAYAVNDRGHAVGTDVAAAAAPDFSTAMLWRFDGAGHWTPTPLAPLVGDPTWVLTSATAINRAGLIGGSGLHAGVPRAFVIAPGVAR